MTTITKQGLEAIGFKLVEHTTNIYDKPIEGSIITIYLVNENSASIGIVDSCTFEKAVFARCKNLEEIYHLVTTIEKYAN